VEKVGGNAMITLKTVGENHSGVMNTAIPGSLFLISLLRNRSNGERPDTLQSVKDRYPGNHCI